MSNSLQPVPCGLQLFRVLADRSEDRTGYMPPAAIQGWRPGI